VSALAEALAPLHRAYLRRLDEMAARLGEQRALREPVAREEGHLVRQESGLLMRLDIVDSSTGEVFEVHGARPDEPAATELRVGGIDFRLEAGNWEELPVRCVFGSAASADDRAALAELLRSWAVLAAAGAFAPLRDSAAADAWSGRLHSLVLRQGDSDIAAILDLGTCPPAAFEVLAQALVAFGRDRGAIATVSIGGQP
jgi:hypothetical protein